MGRRGRRTHDDSWRGHRRRNARTAELGGHDSGAGCTLQVPHTPFAPGVHGRPGLCGGRHLRRLSDAAGRGNGHHHRHRRRRHQHRAAGDAGSRSVSYQPAIDVVLPYPPRRRAPIKLGRAGGKWAPSASSRPASRRWRSPGRPAGNRQADGVDLDRAGHAVADADQGAPGHQSPRRDAGRILCDVPTRER